MKNADEDEFLYYVFTEKYLDNYKLTDHNFPDTFLLPRTVTFTNINDCLKVFFKIAEKDVKSVIIQIPYKLYGKVIHKDDIKIFSFTDLEKYRCLT